MLLKEWAEQAIHQEIHPERSGTEKVILLILLRSPAEPLPTNWRSC